MAIRTALKTLAPNTMLFVTTENWSFVVINGPSGFRFQVKVSCRIHRRVHETFIYERVEVGEVSNNI